MTAPDHLTGRLSLPRVISPAAALAGRIATIRRMAARGYVAVEIAGALDIHPDLVRYHARRNGIAIPAARAGALWGKRRAV